jgi:hypothetical protein
MFTPNPAVVVTPLPLVGAAGLPLQGGELVALGRALIIYRADITSFVLISCTGGAQQGVAAANSNQFVTLGQAGQLFNPALTYFIGQF